MELHELPDLSHLREIEKVISNMHQCDELLRAPLIDDSHMIEMQERERQRHDAIISIAQHSGKTAQNVNEVKETVSDINQKISLLNEAINSLNRRVDGLEKKYETEKRRSEEAEKRNRIIEQRFSLWLTILSVIMPTAFSLMLIWLGIQQ